MSSDFKPAKEEALLALRPGAEWMLGLHPTSLEPGVQMLQWLEPEDGQTEPTEKEIDDKVAELVAAWEAKEYARKRELEYSALNQFELISDDDANGTTTHKDAIAAIKTKWPKDNSGPVE